MPRFQLQSDFKPTGDQPEAISQLIAGVNRGDRHQVLLGATGTGKSLGYADPVYVVEERAGSRTARLVPIGELVDAALAARAPIVAVSGDTQVLDVTQGPVTYLAQAFDPATCQVRLAPIASFIRHAAPAQMYRLETVCGRAATLTGDHNLWVLRDGALALIRTADVRPTDRLPLPEALLPAVGAEPLPELAQAAASLAEGVALAGGNAAWLGGLATRGSYVTGNGQEPAGAPDCPLPADWPNLPDAVLGAHLRAWFDAAGAVDPERGLVAGPMSGSAASALAYALLRLGIWATLAPEVPVDAAGEPADTAWWVIVNGQADLRRFVLDVSCGDRDLQAAVRRLLACASPDPRDAVPVAGKQLAGLRQALGIAQPALAEAAGLESAAVAAYERGDQAPQRVDLLKVLVALATRAQADRHFDPAWWQVWDALQALCRLRWTAVRAVTAIAYDRPNVYDFCVPGAETFLAGAGGLFVHNTFTIANVVAEVQKPTLVMCHNKTLAAQLYAEFKEFFPKNAVEYFVSYYDYYQPEAYVARHDLYIEKETEINDEIDRLRLAATASLLSRRDVLIVASVSCIYGLGSPDAWRQYKVRLEAGKPFRRNSLLRQLVTVQYERNDLELKTGTFRVRGDTLEILPTGYETGFRAAFFGDEVERLVEFDPLTGEILAEHAALDIYPARHFITNEQKLKQAIADIEQELEERIAYFKQNEMLLEAQRIEQRTRYDLEMLREVGYCSGIENYSRPLDQRPPGSPPSTLLDYFPEDYLLVIDESHMTVPQIGGMWGGDRSRKEELIKYGFRLPSALDNRPLSFEEFEARTSQVIYTTATPGPYELERAAQVVQQIIRPTGLVDPEVEVRPTRGQIDDLVGEVRQRVERGERVLITTLTKRMAEDLADYLIELGIHVHYLHSEVETLQRVEILRDLRLGVYDVVVGINLLREGLDLPEVSLVAILDADKEGFLRSETSLIQTIGRAARHINGRVLMYADKLTDSMRRAIDETNRRRQVQLAYNAEHGIVPAGIVKSVRDLTARLRGVAEVEAPTPTAAHMGKDELAHLVKELEKQMKDAAQKLEFEKAALLRDQVIELRQALVEKDPNIRPWQRAQKLAEIEDET